MDERELLARWIHRRELLATEVILPLWQQLQGTETALESALVERGHFTALQVEQIKADMREALAGQSPSHTTVGASRAEGDGRKSTKKLANPNQLYASQHQSAMLSPAFEKQGPALMHSQMSANDQLQAAQMHSTVGPGLASLSAPPSSAGLASSGDRPLHPSWDTTGGFGVSGESGAVDQLERFEIIRELSRGGMGVVYHARYKDADIEVALKVILGAKPSLEQIERFQREAQTLGQIQHPHIVRVRDFGRDKHRPYLAMDFIHGRSLQDVLKATQKSTGEALELDFALELLIPIAEALVHCHALGVIHRDLKPANILVENDSNHPYLADFGLVKGSLISAEDDLTRTGQVLGTPAYMAPEQLDKHSDFGEICNETDVWGFAATLFYTLTGRPPIEGATVVNIYKTLMTGDIPRLKSVKKDLPDWLDEMIAACFVRNPTRRPSMEQVLRGLKLRSALECQLDPPQRLWPALLFASVLVLTTVILGFAWISQDRVRPQLRLDEWPIATKDKTVWIEGRVIDKNPKQVLIGRGASQVAVAKTEANGRFRAQLTLKSGVNQFRVIAQDQSGKRSLQAKQVTIELDDTPPEARFDELPKQTFETDLKIKGQVSEAFCKIQFNGQSLDCRDNKFEVKVPLALGDNVIELSVEDRAGWQKRYKFRVARLKTLMVDPSKADGAKVFKTIQQAVDKASRHTRIVIAPGVYEERLKITKDIELFGLGKKASETQIKTEQADCLTVRCRSFLARNLRFQAKIQEPARAAVMVQRGQARFENCAFRSIEGIALSVTGRRSETNKRNFPVIHLKDCLIEKAKKIGVFVLGAHANFEGCFFVQNRTGIEVKNYASARIAKSQFIQNRHAFYCHSPLNVEILDSEFARSHRAMEFQSDLGKSQPRTQAKVTNCKVIDNENSKAVMAEGTVKLVIKGLTVKGSRNDGLHLESGAIVELEDSEISGCRDDGVSIKDKSTLTIKNCKIYGNRHNFNKTQEAKIIKR